jgi:hypothetical protein
LRQRMNPLPFVICRLSSEAAPRYHANSWLAPPTESQ